MFISVPKEDLSNDTVCIYKITNLVSKKVYIGQTRNLKSRISDYQNPWTKLHKSGINKALIDEGLVNFKFEIEEKCPEEKLTERENYYIKLYDSANPMYGYNKIAVTPHYVESAEIRRKKSLSHMGLQQSAKTKKKRGNVIYAIKDNDIIISDSGKLFGDYIGKGKDLIKNGLKDPTSILGYNFYYEDDEKRCNMKHAFLNRKSIRNEEYLPNLEKIECWREGTMDLNECFDNVFYLSYDYLDENGKPYLVTYKDNEEEGMN